MEHDQFNEIIFFVIVLWVFPFRKRLIPLHRRRKETVTLFITRIHCSLYSYSIRCCWIVQGNVLCLSSVGHVTIHLRINDLTMLVYFYVPTSEWVLLSLFCSIVAVLIPVTSKRRTKRRPNMSKTMLVKYSKYSVRHIHCAHAFTWDNYSSPVGA